MMCRCITRDANYNVSAPPSFPIEPSEPLGAEVWLLGIRTFGDLALHVRDIPYGRTVSALPGAVLLENVGTCSSKHRLLVSVARESGHPEVQLAVGVYEMSEDNTPGVGVVLSNYGISSIPEAHCYIIVEGTRFDFTGLASGASSPFDSLLEEHVVEPQGLAATKEHLHRAALHAWAYSRHVSPEHAWKIRESCISALASNTPIEFSKRASA